MSASKRPPVAISSDSYFFEKDKSNNILVMGVGNYLMGDEGIGVQVIQEMSKIKLPEYVDILDGGTGGAGIQGSEGPQGPSGFQGGVGTGADGVQGPRGSQGLVGAGGQGPSGPQGPAGSEVGPQGATGFQGSLGNSGPQGIAGAVGNTTQGIQGPGGENGLQGPNGPQGVQGTAGGSTGLDIASLHTSGLQGTAMFITMVQGGSGVRPLYGTTSPNPGGEQNFFYTANDDELTVENIRIDGSATLNGSTITTWPSGSGLGTNINALTDAKYYSGRILALGDDAGAAHTGATGGLYTTFVGQDTFKSSNESGNTGLGYGAGQNVTTGTNNTYIGSIVASNNTSTGDTNTGVGQSALFDITSGANNTALGATALGNLTTGNNNAAVGSGAMDGSSSNPSQSTAVGINAGNTITSGTNNLILGYNAQPSTGSVSNEITLGDANITRFRIPGLASGATNGQVLTYNSSNGLVEFSTVSSGGGGSLNNIVEDTTPQLGGDLDLNSSDITGTGDITVTGTVTITGDVSATNFNSTSDESLKENVETIENALSKVINMRGVNFNWVENSQPGTGVIAQEIETVLPRVVTENDEGIKHVQYGNIVGTLIEAIKEQQRQIEVLQELAHPPVAPGGASELLALISDIESRLDLLEE